MKSIVTILCAFALLSGSAFAGGKVAAKGDGWDAINANSDLKPLFPQVQFLGGTVFKYVTEVCVDRAKGELRGGLYEQCTKFDSAEGGACLATQTIELATSVKYKFWDCPTKGEETCARFVLTDGEFPLSYNVPVYRGSNEGVMDLVTTQRYDIKDCVMLNVPAPQQQQQQQVVPQQQQQQQIVPQQQLQQGGAAQQQKAGKVEQKGAAQQNSGKAQKGAAQQSK